MNVIWEWVIVPPQSSAKSPNIRQQVLFAAVSLACTLRQNSPPFGVRAACKYNNPIYVKRGLSGVTDAVNASNCSEDTPL